MNIIVDYYPEYCISFSPNWYAKQIISVNPNNSLMILGINDTVAVLNLIKKQFITILNIENKKNAFLKVTSLLILDNLIIIGISCGKIQIIKYQYENEMFKHEGIFFKFYENLNDILFIHEEISKENYSLKLLICDNLANVIEISFDNKEFLEKLKKISSLNKQETKRKLIGFQRVLNDFVVLTYSFGFIEVTKEECSKTIVKIFTNNKIFSIDIQKSCENNIESLKFVALVKNQTKKIVELLYFTICKSDIEFYAQKKLDGENDIALKPIFYSISLDFHITEKYIKNKSEIKKSSLSIKWLSEDEVIFK